jgi:hypothetical protein
MLEGHPVERPTNLTGIRRQPTLSPAHAASHPATPARAASAGGGREGSCAVAATPLAAELIEEVETRLSTVAGLQSALVGTLAKQQQRPRPPARGGTRTDGEREREAPRSSARRAKPTPTSSRHQDESAAGVRPHPAHRHPSPSAYTPFNVAALDRAALDVTALDSALPDADPPANRPATDADADAADADAALVPTPVGGASAAAVGELALFLAPDDCAAAAAGDEAMSPSGARGVRVVRSALSPGRVPLASVGTSVVGNSPRRGGGTPRRFSRESVERAHRVPARSAPSRCTPSHDGVCPAVAQVGRQRAHLVSTDRLAQARCGATAERQHGRRHVAGECRAGAHEGSRARPGAQCVSRHADTKLGACA